MRILDVHQVQGAEPPDLGGVVLRGQRLQDVLGPLHGLLGGPPVPPRGGEDQQDVAPLQHGAAEVHGHPAQVPLGAHLGRDGLHLRGEAFDAPSAPDPRVPPGPQGVLKQLPVGVNDGRRDFCWPREAARGGGEAHRRVEGSLGHHHGLPQETLHVVQLGRHGAAAWRLCRRLVGRDQFQSGLRAEEQLVGFPSQGRLEAVVPDAPRRGLSRSERLHLQQRDVNCVQALRVRHGALQKVVQPVVSVLFASRVNVR
mmetsp:Transcript_3427/g.9300  ORF Transcript_3427/g.9300 Transcript_3427/m.9300 type:complete len:255 (-) Transcript_3427:638-1402(-)